MSNYVLILSIFFLIMRIRNLQCVLFALSNLCFFILMMLLEETLSPITKGKLPLTLSSYFCQSKFLRKVLKFVTSTEIPASFRCNLLLFKCLFGFILQWVIITISFSAHISSRWAFTVPTFSLKLSAQETMPETILENYTGKFYHFLFSSIPGRAFVPTCKIKVSGSKSLWVRFM